MATSDIVIHIDEALSDEHIHNLERQIAAERGVHSACMHEKTRHLMVVDYDPAAVRPSAIVDSVRGWGFHAQMVGL